MQTYQIRFQVANVNVGEGVEQPLEVLMSAVDQQRADASVQDLPDSLNPWMLDPFKVEAFLSYFPKLPATSLEAFSQRTLNLADENLLLSMADPLSPEQLSQGFGLQVQEVIHDTILILAMDIQRDESLARLRLGEAKGYFEQLDHRILAMEGERQLLATGDPQQLRMLLDQLSHLKMARSACALTWLRTARVLAEASPNDPEFSSLLAQAETAFEQNFELPPTGGMPEN